MPFILVWCLLCLVALVGCAGDPAARLPQTPTLSPEACYRLNETVYRIEAYKKATGQYGEGEEKRLELVRATAAAGGCYLDPDFVPAPPQVPTLPAAE